MAVAKAQVSELFMGQSDIILFDRVEDYNTAKISTLNNPRSLGDIDQDSTEWTGDEIEVEPRRNEQGSVVTSRITNGTQAFAFDIMSTSPENVKEFLAPGVLKELTATTGAAWKSITKVTGFGSTPAVMTRPIMISNDEGTRSLLFPKAKIASSVSIEDGLLLIHVEATAEDLDTADLDTAILIEGELSYVGEGESA